MTTRLKNIQELLEKASPDVKEKFKHLDRKYSIPHLGMFQVSPHKYGYVVSATSCVTGQSIFLARFRDKESAEQLKVLLEEREKG